LTEFLALYTTKAPNCETTMSYSPS